MERADKIFLGCIIGLLAAIVFLHWRNASLLNAVTPIDPPSDNIPETKPEAQANGYFGIDGPFIMLPPFVSPLPVIAALPSSQNLH